MMKHIGLSIKQFFLSILKPNLDENVAVLLHEMGGFQ